MDNFFKNFAKDWKNRYRKKYIYRIGRIYMHSVNIFIQVDRIYA